MDRLLSWLARTGARREVAATAPTQSLPSLSVEGNKDVTSAITTGSANDTKYHVQPKKHLLDRWLDATVRLSGSEPVFLLILAGLFGWAFAGIKLHDSIDWQVIISDVQAILSYLFDSLLMRQQLNGYNEALLVSAQLRSRAQTHLRMLKRIQRDTEGTRMRQALKRAKRAIARSVDTDLPEENWLGRLTTSVAGVLGHTLTVTFYWITIIVWLAFGPSNGWSNTWQLYCNSATSALMVFVFCFLAHIRERHFQFTVKCLNAAYEVDSELERSLRALTGDKETNDSFIIPAPKVNWLQRAIFFYAEVVGTLVGVALLMIFIVVWIAIGPVLHFDDNWWLLIGTYAGLIGLHDGFVLRNVQAQLGVHEASQFTSVSALDEKLFLAVDLPLPPRINLPPLSLSDHVSLAVGRFTASALTVLLGVVLIVGLIIGSSAMGWNTTGQLLCNVPPSIVESFLMIILITGHNRADAERRIMLRNLYRRRLALIIFVEKVAETRV